MHQIYHQGREYQATEEYIDTIVEWLENTPAGAHIYVSDSRKQGFSGNLGVKDPFLKCVSDSEVMYKSLEPLNISQLTNNHYYYMADGLWGKTPISIRHLLSSLLPPAKKFSLLLSNCGDNNCISPYHQTPQEAVYDGTIIHQRPDYDGEIKLYLDESTVGKVITVDFDTKTVVVK